MPTKPDKPSKNDEFRRAWQSTLVVLRETERMMSDPFKAPEQSIELFPELLRALWDLQVEWMVLQR